MKPVKKLTFLFFRFFAIGAVVFAFSLPAFAYEEDTHFQMTYVICRSVGFTHDEALIVAAVDQGMDDSSGVVATGTAIEAQWKWHALDGYTLPGTMTVKGILARRDQFFEDAKKEPGLYNKLIRLGVFFHYQQDTWAHRHHYIAPYNESNFEPQHLSRTAYSTYNVPTGHAPDGYAPDRPPFDPAAALMNLEDGIVYARTFLKEALGREPGSFLADYTPESGTVDEKWNDKKKKGMFFHQISTAGAADKPARKYLLELIRAQIDVYETSRSSNGRYWPAYTPDKADLDDMRDALEDVCDDYRSYRKDTDMPVIAIPSTAVKEAAGFTHMTTSWLEAQLPLVTAFTDGMIISDKTAGKTYLVLDGKLHSVSNINDLYLSPVTVPAPKLSNYQFDYELNSPTYLAKATGDTKIYLIINGVEKRLITDGGMIRYRFDAKPREVTQTALDVIRTGPSLDNAGFPFFGKNGTTVNPPGENPYLIFDQQLHQVPKGAYSNLFKTTGAGTRVLSVKGYLVGQPLSENAYLAKSSFGIYYLVSNGTKRDISKYFDSFGFSSGKVKTPSQEDLNKIPDIY
jgi:hypothetical protein